MLYCTLALDVNHEVQIRPIWTQLGILGREYVIVTLMDKDGRCQCITRHYFVPMSLAPKTCVISVVLTKCSALDTLPPTRPQQQHLCELNVYKLYTKMTN